MKDTFQFGIKEHQSILEVSQFSFSTHAGHSEIVKFAEQCKAETVVVYHTDPNHARPPLVEEFRIQRPHSSHTNKRRINSNQMII